MRQKLRTILATATVLLAISPASAWEQTKMNAQVDASNVSINGNCSGTFISSDLILTANHCIADSFVDKVVESVDELGNVTKRTVRVSVPGVAFQPVIDSTGNEVARKLVRYQVIKHDADVDLALLRVKSGLISPADAPQISCHVPVRGDKVWSVGNPYGVLYGSVATGIVSSIDRSYSGLGIIDDNAHRLLQHTALIQPGSSGGALYDDGGKLVGVNVRGTPVVYFAVSTDDVNAFVADQGITCH